VKICTVFCNFYTEESSSMFPETLLSIQQISQYLNLQVHNMCGHYNLVTAPQCCNSSRLHIDVFWRFNSTHSNIILGTRIFFQFILWQCMYVLHSLYCIN
jgi:hypothetical protein